MGKKQLETVDRSPKPVFKSCADCIYAIRNISAAAAASENRWQIYGVCPKEYVKPLCLSIGVET